MSIPVIQTPFIFGQLCKELTEVKIINATIVNLYQDVSGSPYLLSILDFINIFYGSNGNFGFNCAADPTESWFLLSNWVWSNGTSVIDTSFNIVGFVMGQWGKDLGIPPDCWTVCSKLWITKALLQANNICSLQCNLCCSMSSYELAEILNSIVSPNILNQYSLRSAAQPVLLDDYLALSILFTNNNLSLRPIDIQLNFKMIIADTWKSERTVPFDIPSSGHWSSLDATGVLTIAPVLTTEIRIHKDSLCSGISYMEFLTDDYLNGRTMIIAGESDTCPHITSSELVTPLFVNGQYNNGQDDSNGPDSAGEYSLFNGTNFILNCSDSNINSIVFNNTDSFGVNQSAAITAITSGTLTIQKQSNGYPNNYCLLEVASSATVFNTSHIAGTWTEGVGDLSGAVEVTHSESGELTAYYTITNHTFTDPHVIFDVTYISTIPSGANWAVTSRNSLITIQ